MHPVAVELGLTSNRFESKKMSSDAAYYLDKAKKAEKSDFKESDWDKWGYAKTDICEQLLKTCPDQITRLDASKLSAQEFIDNYEKKNIPVVIRGITKSWKVNEHWTFESIYQTFKDEKFKIAQDDDGYPVRIKLKYFYEYLFIGR
jgi:histone arginine demethylase JMJD6